MTTKKGSTRFLLGISLALGALFLIILLPLFFGGTGGDSSTSWPAVFLAVVFLAVVGKGFWDDRGKPSMGARFVKTNLMTFLVVSAVLAFFLGMSWLSDPRWRDAFDPEGNANYVVYPDVNGKVKRAVHREEYLPKELKYLAGEFIHPSHCKVGTLKGLNEVAKGSIDKHKEIVSCYSTVTGKKMSPVAFDDLPEPSLRTVFVAVKTLVWGPSTSDAEAKSQRPVRRTQTVQTDCTSEDAQKTGCKTITLRENVGTTVFKISGLCPTWTALGDAVKVRSTEKYVQFTANTDVQFNVWHIRKGESNDGFICR